MFDSAHLLTFGTYGAWLHGDARGSWQRHAESLPRNDMLAGYERSLLTQPAVVIDARMRPVIELALIEACARHEWNLLALNVRLEHVHIVVGSPRPPNETIAALKAYCTRRLREEDAAPAEGRVWARGGGVGSLPNARAVCRAINYVTRRQGGSLAGSIFLSEESESAR